ncbi:14556_t:CDS:2 [Acaulospora morrowiae]|uniref:tRNA (guanine(9)-N1)-methyltransferase n=1 Tax=Acaulospora morrowiae TaxID=94023 RepID=A0A9N8ZWK0_9GLOM|nr:14556_t:CDS:2 [Acaulospora morrowiae]
MQEETNDSEGINNSDDICNSFPHKPEPVNGESSVTVQQTPSLSKNALKKLLKRQHWEETRDARKAAQKEKDKKRKLEKRRAIELGLRPPPIKKTKVQQIASEMKVVIDLSFDTMMTDVEIKSVTSQLARCYSANRSTTRPVNLFFTSYGGRVQERFNTKLQDHANWKQVVFDDRPYLECFNKEDLIYLTADATETLNALDEGKVYIIGGIVDKNRHKNICFDKAKKEGIATAQLPIGSYIQLSTRKILTINHGK